MLTCLCMSACSFILLLCSMFYGFFSCFYVLCRPILIVWRLWLIDWLMCNWWMRCLCVRVVVMRLLVVIVTVLLLLLLLLVLVVMVTVMMRWCQSSGHSSHQPLSYCTAPSTTTAPPTQHTVTNPTTAACSVCPSVRLHCSVLFRSVLLPSSIRGLATPCTYFLHLSLSSVILTDSSTGSPVHVLMLSIQAVRGLPRLRALALFLALSLSPGNSLVSSRCDHSMLASYMTLTWHAVWYPSTDFDNSLHKCSLTLSLGLSIADFATKLWFVFPPSVTNVFALPGKTWTPTIACFHLNIVFCFINKH